MKTLVHKHVKATRFYVLFDQWGNAGKSFTSATVAKIFGQYSMINITPSAVKDQFNDWIAKKLFLTFEEAETENYTNNQMSTFVKRFTNIDFASRAMHKSTTDTKNYAIGSLVTNDAGLYGLLRSEEATQRRLVVMIYKRNSLTSQQWDKWSATINDRSFAYSIAKFVYEELEVPTDYSPNRFVDAYDAYEILKPLKKNPVETMNELLEMWKEPEFGEKGPNYNIVRKYTGDRIGYYYIRRNDLFKTYNDHCQLSNRYKQGDGNLINEMKTLGWDFGKKHMKDGSNTNVFFRDKLREDEIFTKWWDELRLCFDDGGIEYSDVMEDMPKELTEDFAKSKLRDLCDLAMTDVNNKATWRYFLSAK
jgi:hypothetical protein